MRQIQPQRPRRQPSEAGIARGRQGSAAPGAVPSHPAWTSQGPSIPLRQVAAGPSLAANPVFVPEDAAGFGLESRLLSLSAERQELICSLIGLTVKLGLVALTGLSLFRLAGAYQQRMESQGEISAVLELENAKLTKARERFDALFMVEGEQRLIREQSQWIAPNRLRVVWQSDHPFPTVESPVSGSGKQGRRP